LIAAVRYLCNVGGRGSPSLRALAMVRSLKLADDAVIKIEIVGQAIVRSEQIRLFDPKIKRA
jgi:hypothetical protein